MMSTEKLGKELLSQGYVPPPDKPVRSVTKGRFNFPLTTPSERFVVDKLWEKKANPIAHEE